MAVFWAYSLNPKKFQGGVSHQGGATGFHDHHVEILGIITDYNFG